MLLTLILSLCIRRCPNGFNRHVTQCAMAQQHTLNLSRGEFGHFCFGSFGFNSLQYRQSKHRGSVLHHIVGNGRPAICVCIRHMDLMVCICTSVSTMRMHQKNSNHQILSIESESISFCHKASQNAKNEYQNPVLEIKP